MTEHGTGGGKRTDRATGDDVVENVETDTAQAAAGTSDTASRLTRLDPPSALQGDSGATAELTKFLSRTPFLDLHHRAGGDGHDGQHVLRGRLCFIADSAVRVVAILLIFGIVAVVAYKTLAPIPAHLW